MKKRILTILLGMVICITSIMGWQVNVNAKSECEDIHIADLWTEDALIGTLENQTRGIFLSDGYSIINKAASAKVGAGGVTNASFKCTVRVTAILERKNSSGSWERVNSWSQTNQNAYSAGVSKTVTVTTGYYYRVRSHHYASTDSSSSCTDALWMGN